MTTLKSPFWQGREVLGFGSIKTNDKRKWTLTERRGRGRWKIYSLKGKIPRITPLMSRLVHRVRVPESGVRRSRQFWFRRTIDFRRDGRIKRLTIDSPTKWESTNKLRSVWEFSDKHFKRGYIYKKITFSTKFYGSDGIMVLISRH